MQIPPNADRQLASKLCNSEKHVGRVANVQTKASNASVAQDVIGSLPNSSPVFGDNDIDQLVSEQFEAKRDYKPARTTPSCLILC